MSGKVTTQLVIEGKNKAGSAFKEAEGQIDGLGAQAKAAGALIAGALTVGSLAGFIKDSIDAADAAGKSAQATGLAVDQYTALRAAAELSDIGITKLDGALGKFNKTIDKAARGGESQTEIFARLGISIRDADGNVKASGALLGEVADKFQQLPDGVQKSALAMELFGKSGGAMIPLLNAGSSGLAEMRKEAEALGVVIGPDQAARSEVFNDNLTKIGMASDGAANQVAGELLPVLIDLSELMVDLNKNTDASGIFADILGGALKVLATIAIIVGGTFVTLGGVIGGAAAAAWEAANGNFSAASDILKQTAEDYKKTTLDSVKRIDDLWSGVGEAAALAAVEQKKQFAASLAAQKNYVDQTKANSDKLLKDAESAVKEQEALQKKTLAAKERIAADRKEINAKYDDTKAALSGTGSEEPSYAAAQALKVNANASLKAGDTAGAIKQAEAARKVLVDLEAAGANTYGLAGFADELRGIELAAKDIEDSEADRKLLVIGLNIATLQAQANDLKNIQVTPTMDEAAATELTARMQALAASLGQTLTITARVVPVAPDGLQVNTVPGNTDVPMPGYATGTNSATPGLHWVGENGPELMAFNGGEKVFTASASANLAAKLAGMQLPQISDSSMIGAAMSAAGAQASRDLGTLNIHLPDGGVLSTKVAGDSWDDLRKASVKFGRTSKH